MSALHRRIAALLMLGLAAAGSRAQTGEPAHFTGVQVSGNAQVTLRQGDQDGWRVLGDADSGRGADVRVVGDRLQLNTRNNWKFWSSERPRVEVQMRDLRRLVISGSSEVQVLGPMKVGEVSVSISGAGSVRMDDLQAQALRFDISGAGDGDLAGQVGELRLSVSGKGRLAAENMKAMRATVSISGVGHADVWAVEDLRISVSGVGSVNYWGNPRVTRSTSGVASVEAKGGK
ncbi:MAG: head GIN domain-containing protein [Pseudomonadota bacterium]